MEKRIFSKQVKISDQFYESFEQFYDFGFESFGFLQAERYKQKVRASLDMLSVFYAAYPECRHLATKSQIYRNIILDSHLIIYRITAERIEVLDMIHSASSIRKIRNIRNIQL